jgi:hypothetical protein
MMLASCGGGGGDAGSGPPDPPYGGGIGTLRLSITDAPACGYDNVFVTVQQVRMHQDAAAADGAAGWSELTLNPPRRIDLLALTNGVLQELGTMTLPAGRYTQLRLVLADNSAAQPLANAVRVSGSSAEVALTTPSAQRSGLKVPTGVEVESGQRADLVIDCDACRSVVRAGNSGNILLKPVLRAVPYTLTGVQGQISPLAAGPQTRVSLQQAGRIVKSTVPDGLGAFVLAPVPPGSYTLVLSAPGRTTMVVRNVVINAGTIGVLGGSPAPLTPPASPTGTLAGTVQTGAVPVDALVLAQQSLADGTVIEVAGMAVDAGNGTYGLVVPTAAPLVAPHVPGSAPLVFAADGAAAGRYTLAAISGSAQKTAGPLVLGEGATVTTGFSFP